MSAWIQPKSGQGPAIAQGDLAGLDGLDAEALGIFCCSDVRPLAGVAGFLDWRLCGALSRTLEARHFEGAVGESMLVPHMGRTRIRRVFVFGLGPAADLSTAALARAAQLAHGVMQRAGVGKVVFAAPAAPSCPELERTFVKVLCEGPIGGVDRVLVEQVD